MAKFHDLRVADVRKETGDTISIAFEIPDSIKNEFDHFHGQYVTLKLNVNGEELRRSYSICSSPHEEEFRIAVKKVDGGRASTFLNNNARVGETMSVMTPMGNFYTRLNPENKNQYVGFAAGSGITPVMSILKTVLLKEPDSSFVLLYGNRTSDSIIFASELNDLIDKYHGRLTVKHILSQEDVNDELLAGRIDDEKVPALLDNFVKEDVPTHYFICGPEQMMKSIDAILQERGVAKENIHFELFTTPVADSESSADNSADSIPVDTGDLPSDSDTASVTIILDDEETVIELPKNGDAILDAAIEEDLDVPFACKGAVCCTCKAKVEEGKVRMEMNYALTDEEVEDGFILTCQSHPVTDKVIVNYDEI